MKCLSWLENVQYATLIMLLIMSVILILMIIWLQKDFIAAMLYISKLVKIFGWTVLFLRLFWMECLVFMLLVRHMHNFGITVLGSLPMLLHYDMFGRPLSRSPFELLQLLHPIPWNFLIIYQYLILLKKHLIYLVKMEPFMLLSLIHVLNAPILTKQQWISSHPFLWKRVWILMKLLLQQI